MRAILTYHSIDPTGSPISVSREVFERHVRWLASGRVRVLTLAELLRSGPREDAVALTFDDGFRNLAEVAWPLLAEHGLPATVYVVSDRVGESNDWDGAGEGGGVPVLPLCGWDELGRMAGEGLTIGVHGRRHRSLVGLEPAELEDEVGEGRARIERELGDVGSTFAYPYGDHDAASARLVAAQFETACTTRLATLGQAEDAHLLPRLDAYYLRAPGRLEGWGSAGLRAYLGARRAARATRLVLRRAVGQRRPV